MSGADQVTKDKESRNVTREYRLAEQAAITFDPGQQVDIAKLMKAAFIHGYATALLDFPSRTRGKPNVRR